MRPEKLCMFCKHFGLDRFSIEEYGTYTGSSLVGGFTCEMGHMSALGENPYDIDDFRKMIRKAETCKNYSPPTTSSPLPPRSPGSRT